jgi:hypothetical protein
VGKLEELVNRGYVNRYRTTMGATIGPSSSSYGRSRPCHPLLRAARLARRSPPAIASRVGRAGARSLDLGPQKCGAWAQWWSSTGNWQENALCSSELVIMGRESGLLGERSGRGSGVPHGWGRAVSASVSSGRCGKESARLVPASQRLAGANWQTGETPPEVRPASGSDLAHASSSNGRRSDLRFPHPGVDKWISFRTATNMS